MARCAAWSSVAGVPNTRTVPPSGAAFGLSSPVMSRTDVVLPQPLGPISPRIVPRSSRRSSDLIDLTAVEALGERLGDDERPRADDVADAWWREHLAAAPLERPVARRLFLDRCGHDRPPCGTSLRRGGAVPSTRLASNAAKSRRAAVCDPRVARVSRRREVGHQRRARPATMSMIDAPHVPGLVYVDDGAPGYGRRRCGRGFVYLDVNGAPLRDRETIERSAGAGGPAGVDGRVVLRRSRWPHPGDRPRRQGA